MHAIPNPWPSPRMSASNVLAQGWRAQDDVALAGGPALPELLASFPGVSRLAVATNIRTGALAVGETAILLQPLLTLVGVSMGMSAKCLRQRDQHLDRCSRGSR